MPRLEKWSLIYGEPSSPYQPPELWSKCIQGNVYGHPRFKDGTFVTTSSIETLDVPNKKATTLNTDYELGEVDPAFLAWIEKKGYKLENYKLENYRVEELEKEFEDLEDDKIS